MNTKKYCNGIYFNEPHEKAPNFVVWSLVFMEDQLDELFTLLKENVKNGKTKVSIQRKKSWEWFSLSIDEYEPKKTEQKQSYRPKEEIDINSIPF